MPIFEDYFVKGSPTGFIQMDAAFGRYDIQEIPLSSSRFCKDVACFLASNGLRMERMDAYWAVQDGKGAIIAGAGLSQDIIKGVAVAQPYRSEGLMAPLITRVIEKASEQGLFNLKVFTKPEYQPTFESLGFHPIAAAPKAILLENGKGLEQYCRFLEGFRRPGKTGVVVMNANPFTLGHRYLVEKALEQVETLYIIPVREDVSDFPYIERKAMIRAGVEAWGERVVVLEGSDYLISAATFPTYFLKDLSDAAETQMRLDINLFATHIAPALGNPIRFVGSEPADPLTARYNSLLQELLPEVVVVPRLEGISASTVRSYLGKGQFAKAAALTPASTHPYLLAALAERALRLELDAPLKPGLVCPDSPGAHHDMDYALMLKGIAAIRPFFAPMALASSPAALRQLGIDAEKAMFEATGGVNTHRGAIFALGLALYGRPIAETAARLGLVSRQRQGIKGAFEMALDGYRELFEDWLPFYRNHDRNAGLTILRIMSTLDDTCIIKRVGYDRAQQVKDEAMALLNGSEAVRKGVPLRDVSTPGHGQGEGPVGDKSFTRSEDDKFSCRIPDEGRTQETMGGAGRAKRGSSRNGTPSGAELQSEALQDLCARYAAEGISPGGAADMLALTVFFDSITT